MYKFKIDTKYKYMKRAVKIDNPHTQKIGKIDLEDILNSSLPSELYLLGEKGIQELRERKTVTLTIITTTTIHVTQEVAINSPILV